MTLTSDFKRYKAKVSVTRETELITQARSKEEASFFIRSMVSKWEGYTNCSILTLRQEDAPRYAALFEPQEPGRKQ